jgi:hypothetical protein
MITDIAEAVEVAALFGKKEKVRPLWFLWNGKKVSVGSVNYHWSEYEGTRRFHHFSVSDGMCSYQLCYAEENLSWELLAVETEG